MTDAGGTGEQGPDAGADAVEDADPEDTGTDSDRAGIVLASDVVGEVLADPALAAAIDDSTAALARGLADRYELHQLASGRSPYVVAGACAYLASDLSDDGPTQETVADAAGCTPRTLRVCARDVARAVDADGLTEQDLSHVDTRADAASGGGAESVSGDEDGGTGDAAEDGDGTGGAHRHKRLQRWWSP